MNTATKKRQRGKWREIFRGSDRKADPILLLTITALCIFGLIMITSIGVPKSIQLSAPTLLYPNCDDKDVDCYLLFKNHLTRLMIGFVAMIIAAKIPYRFWKKTAGFWFIATTIVLAAVLFAGSRYTTFARSWLVIFNTSLQPTEFAKLFMSIYLAAWMEKKKGQLGSFQSGFLPFVVVAGIMILPVLIQPDLGSTLVLAVIASAIYFVAGAKIRHLLVGGAVVVLASIVIVSSVSHVQQRFSAFWHNSTDCREDYCWQMEQAKIAIGSGGFFGKGLTQGVQKSYWLPQATDDFIFAASAEELGFVRTSFVVLAFMVIGWRGYLIARGAPNAFAKLTATGITSWIVFQAFVNIAVNTGLMPITGITLPFISYGGSSLIALLFGSGVLLQLSKYSDYANYSSGRGYRRSYHPQLGNS